MMKPNDMIDALKFAVERLDEESSKYIKEKKRRQRRSIGCFNRNVFCNRFVKQFALCLFWR